MGMSECCKNWKCNVRRRIGPAVQGAWTPHPEWRLACIEVGVDRHEKFAKMYYPFIQNTCMRFPFYYPHSAHLYPLITFSLPRNYNIPVYIYRRFFINIFSFPFSLLYNYRLVLLFARVWESENGNVRRKSEKDIIEKKEERRWKMVRENEK